MHSPNLLHVDPSRKQLEVPAALRAAELAAASAAPNVFAATVESKMLTLHN